MKKPQMDMEVWYLENWLSEIYIFLKIQVDESELFELSEESKEVDQKELVSFLQRTVPLIFEAMEENNSLKSLQSI